jgi:hypothetical protein
MFSSSCFEAASSTCCSPMVVPPLVSSFRMIWYVPVHYTVPTARLKIEPSGIKKLDRKCFHVPLISNNPTKKGYLPNWPQSLRGFDNVACRPGSGLLLFLHNF